MDYLEKIFEKVWTPAEQKKRTRKSAVHLSNVKKYLGSVCQFYFNQPEGTQILASHTFTGFIGEQLYLPEYISWSDDFSLNKKTYLYLALKSCASKKSKIISNYRKDSKIGQRLEFIFHSGRINQLLNKELPYFKIFEEEFLANLDDINAPALDNKIYKFWNKKTMQGDLSSVEEYKNLLKTLKRRDAIPDFLYYSTPCLPIYQDILILDSLKNPSPNKNNSKNEKEKRTGNNVKKMSLEDEKERANPIAHSFEKLQTVDDYHGGSRTDSGDDELDEHSNALDEVELSQITTDGESVSSIYKADGSQIITAPKNESGLRQMNTIGYPEWNEHKRCYLENYCKLYINRNPIEFSDSLFKKNIEEKYKSSIKTYRNKINKIVNEPLWLNRQKEGFEIDYDALMRYFVDIKTRQPSEENFYLKKQKKEIDLSIVILFDQSMSTDSWTENTRVLDVILESIGLCGLLFEELVPNILVAGTWSATRHQCDFQIYKKMKDSWDGYFKSALQISPNGYTRLGPAIRHSISLLQKEKSRRKILLLLTDGKPTDLDSYEGSHGIHDIKKAFLEAEDCGIFPFAITIDKDPKSYFSTMFKNYVTIHKPSNLPNELFKAIQIAIK